MELNELLYLQGEVVKLFRAPQGPDSGFVVYELNGKRRTFFDTSATVHALDATCYIVETHPPGTPLVPNGLPVFDLPFTNDDDGDRALGADSRVTFTPPANGDYLVRVTDANGRVRPVRLPVDPARGAARLPRDLERSEPDGGRRSGGLLRLRGPDTARRRDHGADRRFAAGLSRRARS
jgi:hypothetical protein